MISKRLVYAGVGVAAGSLMLGYGLAGIWWGIPAGPLIGVGWLWAWYRGRRWAPGTGLALTLIVAANLLFRAVIPVLEAGDPLWSLLATVAALVAWNASLFQAQLQAAAKVQDEAALERMYVRRLAVVFSPGVTLALIAIYVRISLNFTVAVALGLISVVGLSQTLRYFGREST